MISPWLVIAPDGNPVVRIDLRGLDTVRAWNSDDRDDEDESSEDLDSEERDQLRSQLVLVCGELEVAIYIADGLEAVERLVEEAAPLTRANTLESSRSQSPVRDDVPIASAKLIILSSHHPDDPAPEPERFAGKEFQIERAELTIGRTDDNESCGSLSVSSP